MPLKLEAGDFLAVQWLGLCASTAGGMGSSSGQGSKISHAVWPINKKLVICENQKQKIKTLAW